MQKEGEKLHLILGYSLAEIASIVAILAGVFGLFGLDISSSNEKGPNAIIRSDTAIGRETDKS